MIGTFFGISSTAMQPFTCNEFSLLIIVKQSILHWFNMKNIITYNRKGLHHELEIFLAGCLGRLFGISSTPMQFVTCNEFYFFIIVKQSNLHWFNVKNIITCYRKGLHHDLEIFHARCLGRFFGISSTPMQPVTCNEFSLIIIEKQSILHWFNMKNTITCDRKGLHHDLEIFHARCLGRFLVFLQQQQNLSHVMNFLF
jgi:hypothetical protein